MYSRLLKEVPLPAKILIVDDETPIIDMLSYNLKQANYSVVVAMDGEQALAQARKEQPDLIILDLMLPYIDGLEVCKILRKEQDVPIIMLTARDDEIDRVVGLELGADDYVVKPFSVRELLVRVKNVLRRVQSLPVESPSKRIEVGALVIDEVRREVALDNVHLDLTSLEFDVLYTLSQHAGQVMSREQLITKVWGYDYLGDLRVVDAVIKRVRAKFRKLAPETELIETIRGIGYKLSDSR
jgi:DNA-binding response OmpR family regulator